MTRMSNLLPKNITRAAAKLAERDPEEVKYEHLRDPLAIPKPELEEIMAMEAELRIKNHTQNSHAPTEANPRNVNPLAATLAEATGMSVAELNRVAKEGNDLRPDTKLKQTIDARITETFTETFENPNVRPGDAYADQHAGPHDTKAGPDGVVRAPRHSAEDQRALDLRAEVIRKVAQDKIIHKVDLPASWDASDVHAENDLRSPAEMNSGARFRSLLPLASFNSFQSHNVSKEEAYALLDEIGVDNIIEVISNGTLPTHLANDLGIPQMEFRAWSSKNISADLAKAATDSCAEALQLKSMLAAMTTTSSNAEASIIKLLSTRLAEVAAQLSPDQWNQAPKVEQVDQIQPLTITVQTAAGAAYVAKQKEDRSQTQDQADGETRFEAPAREIPEFVLQSKTTVDIRSPTAEGHAVTAATRSAALDHMDQFREAHEEERALPPEMRVIGSEDSTSSSSPDTSNKPSNNHADLLAKMQAVANRAKQDEARTGSLSPDEHIQAPDTP